MFSKRLVLPLACLLGVLGWVGSSSAATYSLGGSSGGQLQIGGGLPLPIQLTNPTATGTMFPSLLIPPKPAVTVQGTTTMTMKQELQIPASVLSKPAAQVTLGVFGQNPTLYAVATNLNYVWPTAPVVLNTTARTGAKTTTFTTPGGSNIQYSNASATKFGGPARFALNAGPSAGRLPDSSITIFGIGAGLAPPCTHDALTPVPFPGPGNENCVAGLAEAEATGLAAIGGPVNTLVATEPEPPLPGVGIGKFGGSIPGPTGTVDFFQFTPAGTMSGFTNMATSRGYPFTTGMLIISAPKAKGGTEVFTITGSDSRTTMGAGTIQLVAGALSKRVLSGDNANRGWVRLELIAGQVVPAMSGGTIALVSGVLLALGAFAMARRRRGDGEAE